MRILLLITAAIASLTSLACATEPLKISGPTMGTYYSIVVDSAPDNVDADRLQKSIESRLTEINRQMSTWDDASEISRFNASTSVDWFPVAPEFAAVVIEAKRIFRLTAGAFDPTVSPLIDLWGFGDRREKSVPEKAAIEETLKSIGMSRVEVRLDPPALKKRNPHLQLNLSAIAKGYAVDSIADLLQSQGLVAFVVDIGGENRTGVPKASGDEWKLGIESPLGGLYRVVRLTKSSIATSGDYRNFFEIDGVVYSHAIDPKTGWPVRNPPASVSVIHESCMTADAWATAMLVLGSEKGMLVAKASNLSVLFQEVRNDAVSTSATGLFDANDSAVSGEVSENQELEILPAATTNVAEQAKSASAQWFPFAAAAVIFLIAIAGMAIGTILQNKSIKGSCGGLASMPGSEGKSICDLCTIPRDECSNTELREQMQAAAAAHCEDHDSQASV